MPPESLPELRRQRDLVRQHLDWLEAQIQATEHGGDRPGAAAAPPPGMPSAPAPAIALPVYEPDPAGAGLEARRGCLITVAIVLALLTTALAAIYYWRYRDHPIFLAPRDTSQGPGSPRSAG